MWLPSVSVPLHIPCCRCVFSASHQWDDLLRGSVPGSMSGCFRFGSFDWLFPVETTTFSLVSNPLLFYLFLPYKLAQFIGFYKQKSYFYSANLQPSYLKYSGLTIYFIFCIALCDYIIADKFSVCKMGYSTKSQESFCAEHINRQNKDEKGWQMEM